MTKLRPDNWEPPYPAFVTDVTQSSLNISQLAVQSADAECAEQEFTELQELFSTADGLLHHEHAYHVDGQGCRNDVLLAYWKQPGDFQKWRTQETISQFFNKTRDNGVGLWIESMSSPADYYETNYSRPTIKWGIARHDKCHEDPIHGYYGAMRDRIKAAEDGGLSSPVGRLNRELNAQTRGRHLTTKLPENLCFIRTVQGWNACSDEEKEYFMKHSYPVYQKGVEYLRGNPVETNCISARLMTDVEEHPDLPQAETLAWFLSLTDLEAWTWSHPTHAAIFKTFMKHAEKFNFKVDILLGHEVLVLPASSVHAEYNNCHNKTGFLRFFENSEMVG